MSPKSSLIAPGKLRPWHELVADMIIAEPNRTQRDIARELGRSEYWMSIVVNCDAFKEYLHARKEEIVDPVLRASVEDRFRTVVNMAAEKLIERIHGGSISNKELIEAMKVSSGGLGMGAQKAPTVMQNLYVLPNPGRPSTTAEWAQIVENQTGGQA